MQVVVSLIFCHLLLGALSTAWQLSLQTLPLGDLVQPVYCPTHLSSYLASSLEELAHCLPPRSDHAAPGLGRRQAPAAICVLLRQAGLPADLALYPYRHQKDEVRSCV